MTGSTPLTEVIRFREVKMDQKSNDVHGHDDTKKLSIVVVFLSLFVIALFGLAPL